MKTCITILISLWLTSFNVSAQSDSLEIDSLKKVLSIAKEDTNKVNALNALSYVTNNNGEGGEALQYAEKALALAEKINYKKGKAEALLNNSNVEDNNGDLVNALRIAEEALKLYEELHDKDGIAKSYNTLGNINWHQSDYPAARKYKLSALKLRKELGDKAGIGWAYYRLANLDKNESNFPDALENYYQGLKLLKETGDEIGVAMNLEGIASIYWEENSYDEALRNETEALKLYAQTGNKVVTADMYNTLGDIYLSQGNYSEALKNKKEGLKLLGGLDNKQALGFALKNIANVYVKQGNYSEALKRDSAALILFNKISSKEAAYTIKDIGNIFQIQGDIASSESDLTLMRNKYSEALHCYLASLELSEEAKLKENISSSCLLIGKIYLKLKNVLLARRYLEKNLQLNKEIGLKDLLIQTYEVLPALDSAEGNMTQAYADYKVYILYRDSILNEQNAKEISRLNMQHEFDSKQAFAKAEQDKKDAEAKRIKNQQYFIIAALGIIVFTVVIIASIQYRNNKQKQKANALLQHQKEKVASGGHYFTLFQFTAAMGKPVVCVIIFQSKKQEKMYLGTGTLVLTAKPF